MPRTLTATTILRVRDEPFDDTALIMEALMEIREDVHYVISLLEDEDGEEEEEDA